MPSIAQDWGKIMIGARLEKTVDSQFFRVWTNLLTQGLRPGDRYTIAEGLTAHKAANALARTFLDSDCDTLLFLDSDADVGPDFLERFRTYEPGWQYDVLQAFYVRRGWPPEAIWFKRDAAGVLRKVVITDPNTHDDVALVGLHACLIRREVFERLLGENDQRRHDWFYYPRGEETTEDAAFSFDALQAGFRLGATSSVKAGHITNLTTTWDTYQEYLYMSGMMDRLDRWSQLVTAIANFTGQSETEVARLGSQGAANVQKSWAKHAPGDADALRAFYGAQDNGYLYDLLNWNVSETYHRITRALRDFRGEEVLVIGAGLGTEADLLADRNSVHVFELPGVLRDFAKQRLGQRVLFHDHDTLQELASHFQWVQFSLIVAVDVLEHVHPDEIETVLDALFGLLEPGGVLYAHNNFEQVDLYPMHFDHAQAWAAWVKKNELVQETEIVWRKPAPVEK